MNTCKAISLSLLLLSFLITGGCTADRVWEIANATDNLKCVIVDCSFPNHLEDLAVASGHMTPQMLARDLKKLERKIPILVYHLKPSFERQMAEELDALGLELLNYRIQGQVIHI